MSVFIPCCYLFCFLLLRRQRSISQNACFSVCKLDSVVCPVGDKRRGEHEKRMRIVKSTYVVRIFIASDKPSQIATSIYITLYIHLFFVLRESKRFPTVTQKHVHHNILLCRRIAVHLCTQFTCFVRVCFYVVLYWAGVDSARLKFDSW